MEYLKLSEEKLLSNRLVKVELNEYFLRVPFAHRGLHDCAGVYSKKRVENSKSAIMAAIDKGVGIELDVRLSSDEVPIVFHDEYLGRLTDCNRKLSDLTASQLNDISLPNGECIPTLECILNLVCGQKPILIELKDSDGFLGTQVGILETKVAKLLSNYKGHAAVMSFNPYSIMFFGSIMPDIPRGLVTEKFEKKNWPRVSKSYIKLLNNFYYSIPLGVSFISHNYHHLEKKIINFHNNLGVNIFCWTVRTAAEAKNAFKLGCNITFEGFEPSI